MTPAEYRAAFPRMYAALVARHPAPAPIQLAAAKPLARAREVLLCAPTAAGKTEAWMVPIGERHLRVDDPTPRVLIVSPTRALVNDLYRRLFPALTEAGIKIGRWTGDHKDGGRIQAATLLTPEGLDARLSRGTDLSTITAVILDEIHVLDGSARGDQLRILLKRLRARTSVQVVGASATVADPEGLAWRYLVDPEVVRAGAGRSISGRIELSTEPAHIAACLHEAAKAGFRKVLLFARSRNDVERLSRKLSGVAPFGANVVAHHGSLGRTERLSVEQRFLALPFALCVATSTLEMGIDIGDVDLVALHGVPSSAASLLQRIGRGGRREGRSTFIAFVETAFEEGALRTLLAAGKRGEWNCTAPVEA